MYFIMTVPDLSLYNLQQCGSVTTKCVCLTVKTKFKHNIAVR